MDSCYKQSSSFFVFYVCMSNHELFDSKFHLLSIYHFVFREVNKNSKCITVYIVNCARAKVWDYDAVRKV